MDPRSRRASTALVAVEMALAVVLLAAGGGLLRSFFAVYRADPGFSPANVATTLISLPRERYADAAAQRLAFDRLLPRVQASTGADNVAAASALPGWNLAARPFEVDGAPPADLQERPVTGAVTIGGDYFGALGAPLTRGRLFRGSDSASSEPVAIVNQQFAARYLAGADPIGKRVRLYAGAQPGPWMTVIGVAPDIAQNRDVQQRDPVLYLSYQQRPVAEMWILARTTAALSGVAETYRREVTALDPDLPLADGPSTLTEHFARSYQYRAVVAMLFVLFAVVALLLASLGLYGIVAHAVSERTQEIGLRTAIGASSLDIRVLVLRQALLPLGCGLGGGVSASLALGVLLRAEFAQVTPADPMMLLVACLVLSAAAALGCLVPAHRALRVDPAVALRSA